MKGAPYRHIGGGVIADHGPISLAAARDLARFYLRESKCEPNTGGTERSRLCAARARALNQAVEEAARWRRAAGWRDPDAADDGSDCRSGLGTKRA